MEALVLPAASLVSLGLLLGWAARASRTGTLERNALVGIRTRATMASDKAWHTGHRAAAPMLGAAAWASVVTGLLGTVTAVTGSWIAAVAVSVGYGALLVMLGLATAHAGRAARAA